MTLRECTKRFATLISISTLVVLLCSCATLSPPETEEPGEDIKFGLMVMAHGGSEAWNTEFMNGVEPLKSRYPVEVALGMADAGSMEAAVRRLESQDVSHVGVVRVFVSGESWYERTLQILGVQEGAPPKDEQDHSNHGSDHAMMMPMGFWKVDTDLNFHVSVDGLADAAEMDEVIATRIRSVSSDPKNEVVAVIAHGPGDDDENRRWIEKISKRTEKAKKQIGLREIQVFTLREDWPEHRTAAEKKIRDYIEKANREGLTSIVVPYRVSGFGPYEKVLSELDYRANKAGLLPHPNVTLWIASQADKLKNQALSE